MSEIFLYTPDADIQSSQLEALRRKGFIPVKVSSMDAVKIIPAPVAIPQATLDVILSAACDTFAQYSCTSPVNAAFGLAIAQRLLSATKEPSQ